MVAIIIAVASEDDVDAEEAEAGWGPERPRAVTVEVGAALFPVHDWRSSRGGGSETTHLPAIYQNYFGKELE